MWIKGKLSISFFCCCFTLWVSAQDARLEINEEALRNGYVYTNVGGYYYSKPSWFLPEVEMAALYPYFYDGNKVQYIPVSQVVVTLNRNQQNYSTIRLSNNPQRIIFFSSLYDNFGTGPFQMTYSMQDLGNYDWKEGGYFNPLHFKLSSDRFGGISPHTAMLRIEVPNLLVFNVLTRDVTFRINSFDYFRKGFNSDLLSPLPTLEILHTVPIDFSIAVRNHTFEFTGGSSSVGDPNAPTSIISYAARGAMQGSTVSLQTYYQNFYPKSDVPLGNKTSLAQHVRIPASSMKSYFLNKGTYTTDLNYKMEGKGKTFVNSKNVWVKLRIEVLDMSELALSTNQVTLAFTNARHYKNGVSKDLIDHLSVSRTTPYTVTVKANSSHFSAGTKSIPVSVLELGPAAGETAVRKLSLSTEPQVLILSSKASLDQKYSIKYSIPPSKTKELVAQAGAVFSGTITYTLTAL